MSTWLRVVICTFQVPPHWQETIFLLRNFLEHSILSQIERQGSKVKSCTWSWTPNSEGSAKWAHQPPLAPSLLLLVDPRALVCTSAWTETPPVISQIHCPFARACATDCVFCLHLQTSCERAGATSESVGFWKLKGYYVSRYSSFRVFFKIQWEIQESFVLHSTGVHTLDAGATPRPGQTASLWQREPTCLCRWLSGSVTSSCSYLIGWAI